MPQGVESLASPCLNAALSSVSGAKLAMTLDSTADLPAGLTAEFAALGMDLETLSETLRPVSPLAALPSLPGFRPQIQSGGAETPPCAPMGADTLVTAARPRPLRGG